MNNTWYTIRNSITNTGITEIFIDNEIGDFGIPARTFLNELKAAGTNTVNLHINSPGGSLIDAFAIYDFIKLKGYKVHAYIYGIAASAATIVSSAAQQTYIGEHSYFFIHNPYFGNAKGGPESDLEKMKSDILDIYMKKTGLDRTMLSEMMDKETLLNAAEALDLGFVDGIAKEAKVAALKRSQDSIEKLTVVAGKNIVLNNSRLGNTASAGGIGRLLDNVWAKMGKMDGKIKSKLRNTILISNTIDKPISFIKNQQPMPNTQELQTQLEGLVQQLNDLLQQYFSQQEPKEDTGDAANYSGSSFAGNQLTSSTIQAENASGEISGNILHLGLIEADNSSGGIFTNTVMHHSRIYANNYNVNSILSCELYGQSILHANSNAAGIGRVKLYDLTELNLDGGDESIYIASIRLPAETISLKNLTTDIVVDKKSSNYAVAITLDSSGFFDFDKDNNRFAGIINVEVSGMLKGVKGLSKAPSNFVIRPTLGNLLTLDSTLLTNIRIPLGVSTIDLNGSNDDFLLVTKNEMGNQLLVYSINIF